MKLFAAAVALVAVAGFATAEEGKAKPKFDAEKLVGKWKFTEGTKSGAKVDAKNLESDVTITKDAFTIEGGGEKHVMKFKIDASKSPVQIDMEGDEGPAKGFKAEGIIAIDGDTIKLAYATSIPGFEGKRPEKFESTKDNKAFLFIMKKAK
jgi:uncharacterized protein (TIGR03067 family)